MWLHRTLCVEQPHHTSGSSQASLILEDGSRPDLLYELEFKLQQSRRLTSRDLGDLAYGPLSDSHLVLFLHLTTPIITASTVISPQSSRTLLSPGIVDSSASFPAIPVPRHCCVASCDLASGPPRLVPNPSFPLPPEYGIGQGIIAQNNQIVLSQCAVVLGGLLHVPRLLFHLATCGSAIA